MLMLYIQPLSECIHFLRQPSVPVKSNAAKVFDEAFHLWGNIYVGTLNDHPELFRELFGLLLFRQFTYLVYVFNELFYRLRIVYNDEHAGIR